jgi:hypothetical protein
MFSKTDDKKLLDIYNRILLKENQQTSEDEVEKELGKESAFEKKIENINKISLPEEEFKKVKIKILKAKQIVRQKVPGLAFILDNMKTVLVKDDPKLTTMAVDNFRNIYIDVDFLMNTLDIDETAGVLAHEAAHIANKTFGRRRGRNPRIWNYATDYAMNLAILSAGFKLPKGDYCVPIKEDGRYHVKQKKLKWDFDIDDLKAEDIYKELYNLIRAAMDGQEPPEEDENDQPPPKTKEGKPILIQVGDVIVYNSNGKKVYGIVNSVDEQFGDVDFDPITKEEALRLSKENAIQMN